MKINPAVYNNSSLYGSWYLEGNGSEQTWLMIEFLQKPIPSYDHEDVYRFLTDSDFRKHIIRLASKNILASIEPCKMWMQKYERQIGKKNWYREAVRIVSELNNLPDPKPPFPTQKEIHIYHTIVNSYQYIIPVAFPRISNGQGDERHNIFYKHQLVFYLETYGFEFLDFYVIGGGLGNSVLYIEIKLKQYHNYKRQIMEIYLPFMELATLYQKLFKRECPYQYGNFNYYDLGNSVIPNNTAYIQA